MAFYIQLLFFCSSSCSSHTQHHPFCITWSVSQSVSHILYYSSTLKSNYIIIIIIDPFYQLDNDSDLSSISHSPILSSLKHSLPCITSRMLSARLITLSDYVINYNIAPLSIIILLLYDDDDDDHDDDLSYTLLGT